MSTGGDQELTLILATSGNALVSIRFIWSNKSSNPGKLANGSHRRAG
jgi:hypothetical protein